MHVTKREQGFTLIELLIVGIIVGILATLVAMTYSGVQAKNRNAERQAAIQKMQSLLETYYAQQSKYPSIGELNNPDWRTTNMKELSEDTLRDPTWTTSAACVSNKKAILATDPIEDCYSYQAKAVDGSACLDMSVACAQYTLTTVLEGGEKYVKSSLN